MERQRLSDDALLTVSSELKFQIQNQLLKYIIDYLEDALEGHHAELKTMAMTEHDNPYAFFIVDRLRKRFAFWFESLCLEDGGDGDGKRLHQRMSVQAFMMTYDNKPEKVLQEVVAYLGYNSPEQYLRELEEWFKVSSAADQLQDVPSNSMLKVPMAVHFTQEAVRGVMSSYSKATSA